MNGTDIAWWGRWLRSPVSGAMAATAVGVVSLIGLIGLLPFGSEREERLDASPATEQPADVQPSATIPADESDLGSATPVDINLPPPFGDVARDRPLQTVWLITPEAMSLAADVITHEGGLVVEYMATYGILGDGLAIGTDPLRRVTVASDDLTTSLGTAELAATAPADALVPVATQLDGYLDDHTAVIAVTTDASLWQGHLDEAFGPDRDQVVGTSGTPTTDRSATRSTHVLELQPGSEKRNSTPADAPSRISLIDPEVPGALATSLARAWVESYGGGFDPDLSDQAPRSIP